MKLRLSLANLSRAALAVLALTLTVSCLPNSGPFAGGGPFNSQPAVTGSGGERTQVATTTRSQRPSLAATSFFFGSSRGYGSGYRSGYGRGYGGYGYRSSGYCNSCGYNPCGCSSRSHYGSSHHGHGHSSHGSSSSRSSSSSKSKPSGSTYRVASSRGLRSSQTKPSGYHSLDWYKSRGYDTSKMKLVNRDNQLKGHSSRSSSSSSSKSKSSSSKSKSSSSKKRSRWDN